MSSKRSWFNAIVLVTLGVAPYGQADGPRLQYDPNDTLRVDCLVRSFTYLRYCFKGDEIIVGAGRQKLLDATEVNLLKNSVENVGVHTAGGCDSGCLVEYDVQSVAGLSNETVTAPARYALVASGYTIIFVGETSSYCLARLTVRFPQASGVFDVTPVAPCPVGAGNGYICDPNLTGVTFTVPQGGSGILCVEKSRAETSNIELDCGLEAFPQWRVDSLISETAWSAWCSVETQGEGQCYSISPGSYTFHAGGWWQDDPFDTVLFEGSASGVHPCCSKGWETETDGTGRFLVFLRYYPGTRRCPGDTNGDQQIDLDDLATVLAAYGKTLAELEEEDIPCQWCYNPDADFDGDLEVGLSDLSIVIACYNKTCEECYP